MLLGTRADFDAVLPFISTAVLRSVSAWDRIDKKTAECTD